MRINKILKLAALSLFLLIVNDSIEAVAAETSQGRIAKITDEGLIVLETDEIVLLTGLDIPKILSEELAKSDPYAYHSWPLAHEVSGYLKDTLLGQSLTIYHEHQRTDRYGRLLGQIYRADGHWVQADLIKQGMARVISYRSNRQCIPTLLQLEQQAREEGKGIWQFAFYKVRTPGETIRDIETVQIVQGTVQSTAKIKDRIYLNFGEDYRQDFTGTIMAEHFKNFPMKGDELLNLEGQVIRLRGWISLFNGPTMAITHPEQIELVSPIGGIRGGKDDSETSLDPKCLRRPSMERPP